MKWRPRYLAAAGGAVVIIAAIVVVILSPWSGNNAPSVAPIPGQSTGDEESRQVSEKVWPAKLALHVDLNSDPKTNQPADVVLLEGKMFVVDTGNNRILEVGADNKSFRILDKTTDPKLALSSPVALANSQTDIYVANSGEGQVVIMQPSGTVSRVIDLTKGDAADTKPPRPIGIAVWSDGSFVVSDADNHRLIKYGADGKLLWAVGSGKRDAGENGFNVPTGVALDKEGNVYVVDQLNAQVKKYSSDGKFLSAFGKSGDTAGEFSRAKCVAVDDAGNIYVSDGLQAAVQVFDQKGAYLGLVGRKEPDNPKSDSLFQVPFGLKIVGGKLYVVDRFSGLFVFDLQAAK